MFLIKKNKEDYLKVVSPFGTERKPDVLENVRNNKPIK